MKQKKEFKIIQALNLDNCETSIIKNKNKMRQKNKGGESPFPRKTTTTTSCK